MRYLVIPLLLVLAACMPADTGNVPSPDVGAVGRAETVDFDAAVARVLPVATALCEARRPDARCDFKIIIDERYKVTPNAYQTLDADGRPVLGVTAGLMARIANNDELAFVLSHEAAHHIADHAADPVLNLLQVGGASGAAATETRIAASREMRRTELEADALGAAIAAHAGYDPLVGARFFLRLPDPGTAALSTHPGHEVRWQNVRSAAQALPAR